VSWEPPDASSVPFTFRGRRSGDPITVRHATPNDAPRLIGFLQIIGGQTDFLNFGAGEFHLTEQQEREYIERSRAIDTSLFLVAEIGPTIVSTLTFSTPQRERLEHVGEFGVSVLEARWGEGIGEAMTRAMLEWARRHEIVRKINLEVRVDNARAIALYARLGFVEEGRQTLAMRVGDTFYDTLWMGIQT
jgi:RimJ/RimL family protein N-acetyltransferase